MKISKFLIEKNYDADRVFRMSISNLSVFELNFFILVIYVRSLTIQQHAKTQKLKFPQLTRSHSI